MLTRTLTKFVGKSESLKTQYMGHLFENETSGSKGGNLTYLLTGAKTAINFRSHSRQ